MANIVVIGAGLGGLPTAYELRHFLPSHHTVTVISDQPKFTFIPGLIRVALDLTPLDHFQLDLQPLAQHHGLKLLNSKVTALDLYARQIFVESGETINFGLPEPIEAIKTTVTKRKRVSVDAHFLKTQMASMLGVVNDLFSQAEAQTALQLNEVELSVEINAEGQVSLVGNGGITLKFVRPA